MNTFIPLPSGAIINPAHIVLVREHPDDKESIQLSVVGGDKWMEEKVSLEKFLDLLNPPQTPIVSPVIDLDKLKPGSACQFTYEGQVKHGVIEEIGYSDALGDSFVRIVSNGTVYTLWPSDGEVNRD